jgi:putative ABC transport system permease protein
MDNLLHDARLAWRRLAKAPGFTAVATASLALGIGANTAVFTVVSQGLAGWSAAYERPDELVMVWQTKDGEQWLTTPFDFRDWKASSTPFARMAAYFYSGVSVSGPREAERAAAALVSPDLWAPSWRPCSYRAACLVFMRPACVSTGGRSASLCSRRC